MLSKINQIATRIRKSKDGRTLVANFGYLSLLQIASYAFPLITMPYLARVIGTEGFGKIAFASAVMTWFMTISDWGFNYTATRDVARNRDNLVKVSEIFSNVFWCRCCLMLISLIILLICIISISKLQEYIAILMVTFLMIPGHIMFPDWFFQAVERMKYITVFNVLSKILFTIAVFVFIKEESDYILQPLFVSLGFIISGLISMYCILGKWGVKLRWTSFRDIFLTLQLSTDVFINNLLPNLYNSFSVVLLGFWGGNIANGLLDAGKKFIDIANQLFIILARTFYPFLSRRGEKHGLYANLSMGLALLMSLFLFVFAPLLINLFFTSEFEGAITVLRIMSVSFFFLTLNGTYGVNFMILQGYEKQLRNITFVCSVIGFLISFPLIYFYSYIGAALTITITKSVLGLYTMIQAKKLQRKSTIVFKS